MHPSERSPTQRLFWPVIWAVSLHLLIFAMLFVSFQSTPELPPARPIVQTTLYQLKSQSQATTQTPQKIAGEAKKTAAPTNQVEQLESKKIEQQKQAAAEAVKKKAAEQKKVAEQKRVAEQKKVEQAAIAKKKAEEDKKKKAAEEAKKKAAAEEAKKKAAAAAAAKQKAAQEAARKATEDKKAQALKELLAEDTQYQQAQAETIGDQVAGNFDDLIRQLVSQNWTRPPSARNGMVVQVQINMLPDGTITNASVVRSSGDAGFDNSAVNAVRNVGRIVELQSLSSSDFAPYRSFKMTFTPEDLAL
jgi:colicin import membrane protein